MNGYADIKKAYRHIIELREAQAIFEEKYLQQTDLDAYTEAISLLGLYHISKAVIETADYLIQGYNYKQNIEVIINQHTNLAKDALVAEPRLKSLVPLVAANLKALRKNSIWANTNFNDKVQRFCELKAHSEQGIIELLPSQQDALGKRLLDIVSSVTVLQMPTSAGKTLLAEFDILVTKSLKPQAKIIYVVPSRALVNQVYYDLCADLSGLDLIVEKTSSAIEIDSSEWELLESDKIDVLVSTPEKLDLLIKRSHPSVEDVSLIIVDEVHSIANGQRGAKLEMLLSVLKRETPKCQIFVTFAFFGAKWAKNISDWLAGDRQKTEPIKIDWKPAEKLIVGLSVNKTKVQKNTTFGVHLLKSPYSYLTTEKQKSVKADSYKIKATGEKEKITEFAIKNWSKDNKRCYFFVGEKTKADNLASEIASLAAIDTANDDRLLVKKFIEEEVGKPTTLSLVLEKRIAIHHAGLSDETKLLIEHLIRKRQINYVCATNTIGEGVNFPVSAVFFDSLYKGRNIPITTNDFWNIAGRAGRTLVDNFGTIIFPFNGEVNENRARELLKNASDELVSVLSEFMVEADKISRIFREENNPLNNVTVKKYEASLDPTYSIYYSFTYC